MKEENPCGVIQLLAVQSEQDNLLIKWCCLQDTFAAFLQRSHQIYCWSSFTSVTQRSHGEATADDILKERLLFTFMSLCKEIRDTSLPSILQMGVCVGWCREQKGPAFTRLMEEVGGISQLKASHSSALLLLGFFPVRATEKLGQQIAATLNHIFY